MIMAAKLVWPRGQRPQAPHKEFNTRAAPNRERTASPMSAAAVSRAGAIEARSVAASTSAVQAAGSDALTARKSASIASLISSPGEVTSIFTLNSGPPVHTAGPTRNSRPTVATRVAEPSLGERGHATQACPSSQPSSNSDTSATPPQSGVVA